MNKIKTVFADTSYWVAIMNPRDQWHKSAKQARDLLGKGVFIITTDEVMIEFLTALSASGEYLRSTAVKIVREIYQKTNIKVLPQTRETFLKGLELYEKRLDKKYSLTDCISMNTLKQENITDILSNDNHFSQEGFNILISRVKREDR